jgi:peptide/nickel transport system permease protein
MRLVSGVRNIFPWTIRPVPATRLATRCLEAFLTLAVLITLTFALAHAAPGGPAYAILGRHIPPGGITDIDARLGLNTPLWQQFAVWWWHVLHGNFGTSFVQNRPVMEVIGAYAMRTLWLYLLATLMALAASLALGLLHGVSYNTAAGRICSAVELTLYAMPGFFIATLLSLVFCSWLRILPAGGMSDLHLAAPGLGDRMRHILLPAASVALFVTPWLARILAQSVHTELGRDYVRTAHARFLSFPRILLRHVLPNAVRPMITVLGYSLPAIFSGSIVVESVFDYPGLGWLLWRSAVAHDYPVLIGIVLVAGVATLLGNLLADIVNGILDPSAVYA